MEEREREKTEETGKIGSFSGVFLLFIVYLFACSSLFVKVAALQFHRISFHYCTTPRTSGDSWGGDLDYLALHSILQPIFSRSRNDGYWHANNLRKIMRSRAGEE